MPDLRIAEKVLDNGIDIFVCHVIIPFPDLCRAFGCCFLSHFSFPIVEGLFWHDSQIQFPQLLIILFFCRFLFSFGFSRQEFLHKFTKLPLVYVHLNKFFGTCVPLIQQVPKLKFTDYSNLASTLKKDVFLTSLKES